MSFETKVLGASFSTRSVMGSLLSCASGASDLVTKLTLQEAYNYLQRDPTAEAVDSSTLRELMVPKLAPNQLDKLDNLLDRATKEIPSAPNLSEIDRQIRLNAWADKMLVDLGTSNRNWEKIHDTLQGYHSVCEPINLSPVSFDKVQQSYSTGKRIKTHIHLLDQMLGEGLEPGNHVLVFARPECYPEGTEVLTPSGWADISHIGVGDEVIQFNRDKTSSVTSVLDTVKYWVDEDLVRIHDTIGRVDLSVTGGHNMVVEHKGDIILEKACECLYYQGKKHHTSAQLKTERSLALSVRDRIAIAYQADGRSRQYTRQDGVTTASISVKKQRKIKRLRTLLNESGLVYREHKEHARKYHTFYIQYPDNPPTKDFSWVDLLTVDHREFIEELSYWDATRRTDNRFKFDTTNSAVADVVQAICVLAGYNAIRSLFKDNRKETYSDIHSISIRTRYKPSDGQSIHKTRRHYTGQVTCLTVDSGMLIVRQNGKVAVSGNCGKSLVSLNLAKGFAEQGLKGIYFENEEPAHIAEQRLLCAIAGKPIKELLQLGAKEKARVESIASNVVVHQLCPGTLGEIESLCQGYDWIIINQLRNLQWRDSNKVVALEELAKGARSIGSRHKLLVVSVTQAGDSAEGKLVLNQGDVDFSNTGIPSAVDVMIGIGVNEEKEKLGYRVLSLPKNKTGGGHGSCTIKVDPARSLIVQ